jgi:peptidoglycan-associated lipoprotein
MKRVHSLVLMGLGVALVVACGKKPETAPTPQPNADSLAAAERARAESLAADSARRAQEEAERIARQRAADSAAAVAATTAEVRNMLATMVHFDYDRSNIRAGDDQSILDQKVAILTANPDLRIRISGHCDERGSDEYNLALGNRRATSAKQYLVSHGIDASRIETASFGEERPIAMGHDEDSWAQNRRDEFEILSGGDMLMKP